jgi:hypothetical protein
VPLRGRTFPVFRSVDLRGNDQTRPGDETRHLAGRDGDNLLLPFQCEICHIRNMCGRDPIEGLPSDEMLKIYIRRASIDAFWSREPAMVRAHLREARQMEKEAREVGLTSFSDPIGPWPLRDVMGMRAAVAVLQRSLAPGLYAATVQFETIRKTRSTLTVLHQASVGGSGDAVGAHERKKVWISNVQTHTFWFCRFMEGVRRRTGEIIKRDELISIDVLHSVDALLEQDWRLASTPKQKKRVAEMGVIFVAGFCSGVRGEELLIVDLLGTKESLKHLGDSKDPHFKLELIGRLKGHGSEKRMQIPPVGVTEVTGLQPGKWITRLASVLEELGRTTGKLLQRNMLPARLVEFQNDFYGYLEKVQATTGLISDEMDVRDAYGLRRSTRRGVTAHAKVMHVDSDVIKAVHRWEKELNSRSGFPRLDMIDTYDTLVSLVPLILKYSRSL